MKTFPDAKTRVAGLATWSALTSGMVLASQVMLCAALLSVAASPAHAEDKTAAREHWERGTKFYDLGKYDEAIKEFESAYEAKSDPAFLYNLAQSHRLAGHTNDALRFYRTYLRYVPKAANRADIEQRIKELEKVAAGRPAPAPAPTVPPPAVADPPPPTPAVTPPAVTSLPSPGGSGGGALAPTEPTFPSAAPSTGTTTAPNILSAPPESDPPPGENSGRRTIGIAVAAAGGGLVVVGAIFGLVARRQSNKVEEVARANGRFDPSVQSLGQTSETLQWIGYGLGLAAVATGAILYIKSGKTDQEAAAGKVALAPLVSPQTGGVQVRVTF